MPNNLAQYFAQAQQDQPAPGSGNEPRSQSSLGLQRTPSSYSIHSKAVDAQDDKHFEDTSFQLKRTRSVGLLDEFIEPTKKLIEEDEQPKATISSVPTFDYVDDDEDGNQFIENVEDEPKIKPKEKNIVYTYDDEIDEENYEPQYNNENEDHYGDPPSHAGTPDLHQPHDDNDIVYEPQSHVDYLSHDWQEEDISKSWRYIVERRKDVANSARLENASWRTWAQSKYHLRTISPESVNWLKDSDVTWLYGPLYKEPDHESSLDNPNKKYGSDNESSSVTAALKMKKKKKNENPRTKGIKPILKKRTVTEMLSQPSRIMIPHNYHNAPSPPTVEDDFDLISRKVNAQYSTEPDLESASQVLSDINTSNLAPSVLSAGTNDNDSAKLRRVHFNDRVDQCISLNYVAGHEDYDGEDREYDSDDDEDYDSEDSDDEGGFFLKVRSPSSASLHNRELVTSMSANTEDLEEETKSVDSNTNETHIRKSYSTIAPLPATTLNHGSDEEEEETDMKFTMSHNTNTNRGFNYLYDYNSVFIGNEQQCHDLLDASDYEFEDTPQHLEGVNMVDVPKDIVLGSNIDIVDAPQFVETTLPNNKINNDSSKPELSRNPEATAETDRNSSPSLAEQLKKDQKVKVERNRGVSFNDTDSELDSDENSTHPFCSSTTNSVANSKGFGDNLGKISSSPSYASLSDVAAKGFFSQSPNSNLSNVISGYGSINKNDVNDLQKDLSNLDTKETENTDSSKEKGFRSSILNSWKKHDA